MSKLFTANYPGRCDANGCRIEEGDHIGFADGYDRPLCESCWCADKEETEPPGACPNCFTIVADWVRALAVPCPWCFEVPW